MTRRTLSDVNLSQEAMIDKLLAALEQQTRHYEALVAALMQPRQVQAAESIKLSRAATGDHATAPVVEFVRQEGETVAELRERARREYETLSARFPLPSGYAHAAQLGPLNGEGDGPPSLEDNLRHSVKAPDDLAKKRGGK